MKEAPTTSMPHPLFVLVAAALGGATGLFLLTWRYRPPTITGTPGQVVPAFTVWLFLIVVYTALLGILLVPMWALFIRLFRQLYEETDRKNLAVSILLLFLTAVVMGGIIAYTSNFQLLPTLEFHNVLDPTHHTRINILFLLSFLVILPGLLGIVVIYLLAEHKKNGIRPELDEANGFQLAGDLIGLRGLLQNILLFCGIILSMVPINTAALRATVITADSSIEPNFPLTYVIIYGLFFTILLILIYTPAHLKLIEVGRALRDEMCPFKNMTMQNLDEIVAHRKSLDDLLQTNIGFGDNLKSSIATFSPLVTSLILSLLGTGVSF